MKKSVGKILSLLIGGVLLLSAVGCGKEKIGTVRSVEEGSTAAQTTTREPRKVELHTGVVGEEVNYKDVYATLEHVYLPDYSFTENEQEIGIIFFELSIENQGDEALCVDILSRTFGIETDGEAYPGVSVRGPRFIHKQFGEEASAFYDEIQPGETQTGFVCVEVPADFQVAKLMYFPRAGAMDWDEAYTFEVARTEMEAAPAPVEAY